MICPVPIKVRKGRPDEAIVPCGKCYYCRQNYRNMWITRLKAEFLDSVYAIFVTLTYEKTPTVDYYDKWTGEVITKAKADKHGFQKFLKRLRKKYKVRYFAISEYGEKTLRPHWHALFFLQFVPGVEFYDYLTTTWHSGIVHFGTCTDASIVYCTKYLLKSSPAPYDINDEYMLCSRKPPIGFNKIMSFKDYAQKTENFTQLRFNGYSAATPRLYRDKFKLGLVLPPVDMSKVIEDSQNKLKAEFEKSTFSNFYDFLDWKLKTEKSIREKNHSKHNKL